MRAEAAANDSANAPAINDTEVALDAAANAMTDGAIAATPTIGAAEGNDIEATGGAAV